MGQTRVYPRDSPPSAVRGWLRRLRGLITFNRRVSHEGKNEIHDAHVYREYKRDRKRGRGYEQDGVYRPERRHPFLHFPRRCRPPYHGAHFRLWGFLTRRREHLARGLSMHDEAERERRRERRRRQRRLAEEGMAIRLGAKTILHGRSSRRHHHHSSRHSRSHHHRGEGFTPIVTTASNVGHEAYSMPVVRTASTHGHHRHHSSNGGGVPLMRTLSSHHHGHHRSGSVTPVAHVAPSGYVTTHSAPISRAASSRHGYVDERAIPVVRSSSRHGSSRYGDVMAGSGVARTSSSRHGHRYHGHSRSPTEMYVPA